MGRRSWVGYGVLALVAAAILTAEASAATRGISVMLKASEATDAADAGAVELYDSSYALVIGNDAYRDSAWPRLSNAVRDARAVAAALEAKGFEVTLKTDLDAETLSDALKDFFIRKGRDPQSRLFVWFAGHGHTMNGEGFLVPTDGPAPRDEVGFLSTAVSLRDFGKFVRYAKSKHVYAVFDSCFAGTVFNVARSRTPPAITRVTAEPVRQFLSSGDAGQQVSDDGRFARMFIEALEGRRRADANADGYLTASEIGAYLTYEVANLSYNRQTPRHGKLASDQFDKGDFVFVLPGAKAKPSHTDAPTGGADATVWAMIQNSTNALDYKTFLASFPDSPFSTFAQARLDALGDTQTASLTPPTAKSGPRPEDIREAQRLLTRLGYTPGPADGVIGARTRDAIASFQRSNGLPVDRTVTDALLAALRDAPARSPDMRPGSVFRDCIGGTASWVSSAGPDLPLGSSLCGPEMVVIPPGSFRMGDLSGIGRDNERPVHDVRIRRSFAAGRYEVTQGQFAEFIRDTGRSMSSGCKVWTGSDWKQDPDLNWRNPGFDQTETHPVTCVSWHDADAYAEWLSAKTGKTYRLLTEAEWEYAARAGSRTDYPWGDNAPTCKTGRSNSARTTTDERCSGYGTVDVGSFAPNAFGLFDTVGNLWEWTEDCSHDYGSAPSDGSAYTEEDCAYRIIRGGTWSARQNGVRTAVRYGYDITYREYLIGFRIARDLR